MEEVLIRQGRSLEETPTYTVASVITVLIFVCFLVQRAIYRFGKVCFVPQKMSERKSTFPSYVYLILFKPTLLILLSCTHSLCVQSCILLGKRE